MASPLNNREFDNWEVEESSPSTAGTGIRGFGKFAIVVCGLIATFIAVALLIESDNESRRRRWRRRSRRNNLAKVPSVPRFSRARSRARSSASTYRVPQRPKDPQRHRDLLAAAKAYDGARRPAQTKTQREQLWMRRLDRTGISNWLQDVAKATAQSSEHPAAEAPYLDYEGHADIIYTKWQNKFRKDRPKLLEKLKNNWRIPVEIKELRIASFARGRKPNTTISVHTFCRSVDDRPWRIRFDLKEESSGDWKLVDFYLYDWLIESSERNSEALALYGDRPTLSYARWRNDIEQVERKLAQFRRTQDKLRLGEALSWLRIAVKSKVRAPFQPEMLLRTGRAWEELGFVGTALSQYRAAAQLGCPGGYREMATFFLRSQATAQCQDAAQSYLTMMGAGPWVFRTLAHVSAGKSFADALDIAPDDRRALFAWALRLRTRQDKRLLTRLKETTDPVDSAIWLMERLIEDRSVIARTVFNCLDKLAANPLPAAVANKKELWAAQILRIEGKHSAATSQFVSGWKKAQDAAGKKRVLQLMFQDAWHWGAGATQRVARDPRGLYESSPDRQRAIRLLYAEFVRASPENRLWKQNVWIELIKSHRQKEPADPAADYLAATLTTRDLPERIRLLQNARRLAEKSQDPWLPDIRRELGKVFVFSGKSEQALQLLGSESHRELMQICVKYRHWRELEKLLKSAKKTDASAEVFRAELLLGKGKISEAVALLNEKGVRVMGTEKWYDLMARCVIHKRGWISEQYHLAKDKVAVFNALTRHLRKAGDWKQLIAVAKMHSRPTLGDWEAARALQVRLDALWQAGSFRSLYRAKSLKSWPPKGIIYFSPRQRDELAERLVRAALRSRVQRTAARRASQIIKTTGQTFPQLLVYAAQNKVSRANSNFSRGWSKRPDSAQLMLDPELGNYIRSPRKKLLASEPPATPRFLDSVTLHLLQRNARKISRSKVARQIRVPKRKTWLQTTRSNPDLLFQTNTATFAVAGRTHPLKLDVDAAAFGDRELAKSIRNHKSHISITLHGYYASNDVAVRDLISVVRYLVDKQTSVLIVNNRAVKVDPEFRLRIRSIRTLGEFDDNHVFCASLFHAPKPLDYEEQRVRRQRIRRILQKSRQYPLVEIELGLVPHVERAQVRVTRVMYKGGRREIFGRLESKLRYRNRLRKGMQVSIRAEDVVRVIPTGSYGNQ